MKSTQSIYQLINRLWQHISLRRRRQFGFLLVLMIMVSFSEILTIGAILPFLGVLTSPDSVFEHSAAQPFIQMLGITRAEQLLLPLTIIFGMAALIAGAMRLLLLWANTRLSYAIGADLSINIYRRTLYQPYAVHIQRNSSEIINGISNKTNFVIGTIMMLLSIIGSSVLLGAILFALLSVNPMIAFASFGGFGLIYAFIVHVTRKQLLVDSERIARESTNVIKSLQEGLGGIRDVLIDGSQEIYCQIYRDADLPLRRAQGNNLFITQSPRYGMEALGMLLIAGLAYILAQQEDGIISAIPVLGAFALGAQRLLPVLQQAYAAWSGIRGGQISLLDTLELLEQPLPDYAEKFAIKPMVFEKEIYLNKVSFKYNEDIGLIANDINLKIMRGSRVGLIGETGSGKSTLLDIIMGLLQPTSGELKIDGALISIENQSAWQAHIAHVPQTIFLSDSSIEENIAFGIPIDDIDYKRVRQAAHQAQIAEVIETWPDNYKTLVGERGVRLSGGQRQRIGIARALYKQADVIIFDEATSALDDETERAVMQSIESLSKDLTIIIVAHRLTTLRDCSLIVELAMGGIKRIGTYAEIMDGDFK